MRSLSTGELMAVWERGTGQPPMQQALLLLATAWPELSHEQLARFSIGQRDAHLLTLREWMFGPHLVSLAVCPQCAERLELAFTVADIRVAGEAMPAEGFVLSVDGYEVRFRPPNSLDLIEMTEHAEGEMARQALLERCVSHVQYAGQNQAIKQMPATVSDALVARMAEVDPQAEITLALNCPTCQHRWSALFDVVSFFWTEIDAWAYRTLRDVHTLARAYGWRETDILAMSTWRRQAYLKMVHE